MLHNKTNVECFMYISQTVMWWILVTMLYVYKSYSDVMHSGDDALCIQIIVMWWILVTMLYVYKSDGDVMDSGDDALCI